MAGSILKVTAPGRTEIAGNHTDHEGGHVIASAINRYITGTFELRDDLIAHVESEGRETYEMNLAGTNPRAAELNTSPGILRGVMAQFVARGCEPRGFNAKISSTVPSGGGLSSSAAYELLLCEAARVLWGAGDVSKVEMAQMSQRVEKTWFGKPCGLMDQAACALGSIQHMDFSDNDRPAFEQIDFDFADAGYGLCIIMVGADHAALTDEYAAVPAEMMAVAKELGVKKLGQIQERDFLRSYGDLRAKLGDRPVLRAAHFYREERLVAARVEALKAGDMKRFLELTRLSGASSAMYLQNVSVAGSAEQPTMVALALADELLGERGAVRVHGGGFGGTIQAFVPTDMVGEFARSMDKVLGDGATMICSVDHKGVCSEWL